MPRRVINKLRDAIRTGNHDMTRHAVDEMAEDKRGFFNVESAVLTGEVAERKKDDTRGIKYVINGLSTDESTLLGVVGRFKETGVFLIITVYKIT